MYTRNSSRRALDDDRAHIHEQRADDDAEQNPVPLDAGQEVLRRRRLGVVHRLESHLADAVRRTVRAVVELLRLRELLVS